MTSSLLAHLRAAAADQLPAARLVHLLEAWRLVPAPELTALVDEVSRACRAGQPSLFGETAARKSAWTAVVERKDPADTARLVESLLVRDERTNVARLRALAAAMPRNPYLVTALADLFAARGRPDSSRLLTALEEALLASEDPRLLDGPLLARLPVALDPGPVRERLRGPGMLDESALAVLSEVTRSIEAHTRLEERARAEGAALLCAIYEHPHEDGPREVYADWLTTRGDARGELITLQLARTRQDPSRKALARERTLLDEQVAAWLGTAAQHITTDGARFERGFLAGARLEKRWPLGPLSEDVWRTCLELDLSDLIGDAEVLALLESDALSALERVVGASRHVLAGLARTGPGADHPRPRLDALRARLRAVGSVGTLGSLDDLDGLGKAFPRLEGLVWFTSGDPARFFAHVLDGELGKTLAWVRHTQAASSKGQDVHSITIERDAGALSKLHIAFGGRDAVGIHVAVSLAVEVIDAIGPRMKDLAMALPPKVSASLLAPLERAAQRVGLTPRRAQ